MKTASTTPFTFSVDLPREWTALTQSQLRYVITLMAQGRTPDDIAAHLTLRLMPPYVRAHTRVSDLALAAGSLAWVAEPPRRPVRPETLERRRGLPADLMGTKLIDWLTIQNLITACQQSRAFAAIAAHEGRRRHLHSAAEPVADAPRPLYDLIAALYPRPRNRRVTPPPITVTRYAALAVTLWISGLMELMRETFPHLYARAAESDAAPDMREVMEAQIRALTRGDVTKRDAVLETETWAALAELDAQARESQEMEAMQR